MQEINLNSINARLLISFLIAGIGAIVLVVFSYFFFEKDLASRSGNLGLEPVSTWAQKLDGEISQSHILLLEYSINKETSTKSQYDSLWASGITSTWGKGDALLDQYEVTIVQEAIENTYREIEKIQGLLLKEVSGSTDKKYNVSVDLSSYQIETRDTIIADDLQGWVESNARVSVGSDMSKSYITEAGPQLDSLQKLLHYYLPLSIAGIDESTAGINPNQTPDQIAIQVQETWTTMGRPKYISDLIISISLTLLILLYLGGMFLLYYMLRGKILHSIGLVRHRVNELSEGNLPETTSSTEDELNIILKEIEELTDNLRDVKNFALEVGNGQFDNDISVFNNQGDIGRSLAEMRDSLKRVDEEDKRRNWVNEGMAKFGDILRRNSDNIGVLCDQVIINLVKYLEANQGAIFLINEDRHGDPYMGLQSAYAYERKKFLNKEIKHGEGLIGTVWDEGESIYMVDIPQGYINIGSGLGHARPDCLLIVPLKVNEEVFGALEIASFGNLSDYQINFVESIAESIASSVSNVRTNERTRSLLEESQQMTEEMKSQEEEMRQNMEELQATQEEMQRKARETEELLQNSRNQEEQFRVKTEELQEQEAKLRESQYDTMAIMEGMPDLVFVCTDQGIIEDVNSATMEAFAELGQVQGDHITQYVPAIDVDNLVLKGFAIVTAINDQTYELYTSEIEKMKGSRILFSLRPAEGKEATTLSGPDNLISIRKELEAREKELLARLKAYEAQLKDKK